MTHINNDGFESEQGSEAGGARFDAEQLAQLLTTHLGSDAPEPTDRLDAALLEAISSQGAQLAVEQQRRGENPDFLVALWKKLGVDLNNPDSMKRAYKKFAGFQETIVRGMAGMCGVPPDNKLLKPLSRVLLLGSIKMSGGIGRRPPVPKPV